MVFLIHDAICEGTTWYKCVDIVLVAASSNPQYLTASELSMFYS